MSQTHVYHFLQHCRLLTSDRTKDASSSYEEIKQFLNDKGNREFFNDELASTFIKSIFSYISKLRCAFLEKKRITATKQLEKVGRDLKQFLTLLDTDIQNTKLIKLLYRNIFSILETYHREQKEFAIEVIKALNFLLSRRWHRNHFPKEYFPIAVEFICGIYRKSISSHSSSSENLYYSKGEIIEASKTLSYLCLMISLVQTEESLLSKVIHVCADYLQHSRMLESLATQYTFTAFNFVLFQNHIDRRGLLECAIEDLGDAVVDSLENNHPPIRIQATRFLRFYSSIFWKDSSSSLTFRAFNTVSTLLLSRSVSPISSKLISLMTTTNIQKSGICPFTHQCFRIDGEGLESKAVEAWNLLELISDLFASLMRSSTYQSHMVQFLSRMQSILSSQTSDSSVIKLSALQILQFLSKNSFSHSSHSLTLNLFLLAVENLDSKNDSINEWSALLICSILKESTIVTTDIAMDCWNRVFYRLASMKTREYFSLIAFQLLEYPLFKISLDLNNVFPIIDAISDVPGPVFLGFMAKYIASPSLAHQRKALLPRITTWLKRIMNNKFRPTSSFLIACSSFLTSLFLGHYFTEDEICTREDFVNEEVYSEQCFLSWKHNFNVLKDGRIPLHCSFQHDCYCREEMLTSSEDVTSSNFQNLLHVLISLFDGSTRYDEENSQISNSDDVLIKTFFLSLNMVTLKSVSPLLDDDFCDVIPLCTHMEKMTLSIETLLSSTEFNVDILNRIMSIISTFLAPKNVVPQVILGKNHNQHDNYNMKKLVEFIERFRLQPIFKRLGTISSKVLLTNQFTSILQLDDSLDSSSFSKSNNSIIKCSPFYLQSRADELDYYSQNFLAVLNVSCQLNTVSTIILAREHDTIDDSSITVDFLYLLQPSTTIPSLGRDIFHLLFEISLPTHYQIGMWKKVLLKIGDGFSSYTYEFDEDYFFLVCRIIRSIFFCPAQWNVHDDILKMIDSLFNWVIKRSLNMSWLLQQRVIFLIGWQDSCGTQFRKSKESDVFPFLLDHTNHSRVIMRYEAMNALIHYIKRRNDEPTQNITTLIQRTSDSVLQSIELYPDTTCYFFTILAISFPSYYRISISHILESALIVTNAAEYFISLIATNMGYVLRMDLLEEVLSFCLYRWFSGGRRFNQFPNVLFGCQDIFQFLLKYGDDILVEMFMCDIIDGDVLRIFKGNSECSGLLKRSFPKLLAVHFSFTEDILQQRNVVLDDFLVAFGHSIGSSWIDAQTLENSLLYGLQKMDGGIARVEENLNFLKKDNIIVLIKNISNQFECSELASIFTDSRTMSLLLSLHYQFQRTHFDIEKLRVFNIVQFVVDMGETFKKSRVVLKYMGCLFKDFISNPTTAVLTCDLLQNAIVDLNSQQISLVMDPVIMAATEVVHKERVTNLDQHNNAKTQSISNLFHTVIERGLTIPSQKLMMTCLMSIQHHSKHQRLKLLFPKCYQKLESHQWNETDFIDILLRYKVPLGLSHTSFLLKLLQDSQNLGSLNSLELIRTVVTNIQNLNRKVFCESSITQLLGRLFYNILPQENQNRFDDESSNSGFSTFPQDIVEGLYKSVFQDDKKLASNCASILASVLQTQSGRKLMTKLEPELQEEILPFKTLPRSFIPTDKLILLQESLWSSQGKTLDDWISRLSIALISELQNDFLSPLISLLSQHSSYPKRWLPALLFSLIVKKSGSKASDLMKWIRGFFSGGGIHQETKPLRIMVDTIMYIRKQGKLSSTSPHLFEQRVLNIDFFDVAKSAFRCSMYSTVILCMEIWMESHSDEEAQFNSLYETYSDLPEYQKLLMDTFRQMSELDVFYGIDSVLDEQSLILKHVHEGNWTRIFQSGEMQLHFKEETPSVGNRVRFLKSMQELGMSHLGNVYSNSISSQIKDSTSNEEFKSLCYESAWKLGEWDSISPSESPSFHPTLFSALQKWVMSEKSADGSLNQAKIALHEKFSVDHQLHSFKLHETLFEAAVITEIEEFKKVISIPETSNHVEKLVSILDAKHKAKAFTLDFDKLGTLLSVRSSILKISLGKIPIQSPIYTPHLNVYKSHLFKFAKIARKNRRLTQSLDILHELSNCIGDSTHDFIWRCFSLLEKAKTHWELGEQSHAIKVVQYFLDTSFSNETELQKKYTFLDLYKDNDSKTDKVVTGYYLQAKLLLQVGRWLSETRSDRPRHILAGYYLASRNLLSNPVDSDEIQKMVRVVYTIANYCHHQYEELRNCNHFMDSVELNKRKADELRQIDEVVTMTRDATTKKVLALKKRKIEKQVRHDQSDLARVYQDKNNYLSLCVEGYLQCLHRCEKYNYIVYSFSSLWLSHMGDTTVMDILDKELDRVPSWKFICLIYQMTSRLGLQSGRGGDQLTSLVFRISKEHLFHSVYQLLALKNSHLYPGFKESDMTASSLERKRVVDMILNKLKTIGKVSFSVQLVDQLCQSYIELAGVESKLSNGSSYPFKRTWKIYSIKDCNIPICTKPLPISSIGCYKEFPSIIGFEKRFHAVGGINAPKRIECIGSDGKLYKQLVKGRDDLRQDAVMQQIFSVVNDFLIQNKETRARRITIRTYSVIPLTSRSGVLEWVSNTIPVGQCWEDLRKKIYPKGMTSQECRQIMDNVKAESSIIRINTFTDNILPHYPPVSRHFFLERYLDAEEWFQKKITYTRSVASSSMIGYVLGLGDRHCHNILVDEGTAEVIHIDLGIAFDQGKLLAFPELVPFRLTREMIDGMGLTKVEGVFKKSCENILQLLREKKALLLMILEVFKYDPLYNWSTLSFKADSHASNPMMIGTMANSNSEEKSSITNTDAERALHGVKQKLDSSLNVESHVNELIQDATSIEHLALLFPGWQAWN